MGLAILPDGKLLVSGAVADQAGSVQAVAVRLNEDGTTDESFGSKGLTSSGVADSIGFGVMRTSDYEQIRQLIELEDGDLLVVGSTSVNSTPPVSSLRALRYSPAGIQEPSFDIASSPLTATDALVDENLTSAVARFLFDGTPDKILAGDGVAEIDLVPDIPDHPLDVSERPDGKLCTIGLTENMAAGTSTLVLARYNPTGRGARFRAARRWPGRIHRDRRGRPHRRVWRGVRESSLVDGRGAPLALTAKFRGPDVCVVVRERHRGPEARLLARLILR